MDPNEQNSGETAVEKPKNDFILHGEDDTAKPEAKPENEAKVQEDQTTEEDASEDTPSDEGKKPKRGGFQKKIERLNAALAERDETIRRFSAGEQPKNTSAKSDDASAPKETDYETFAEYNQAVINHTVKQQMKAAEAETSLRQQFQGKVDRYNSMSAEFKKVTPDFDKVIQSSDIEMTEPLRAALLDSDMGPEVAYYLAKNPDEADEIADLGIIALNRRIAKIEAKIDFSRSNPKTVAKTTQAPTPITPVGNGKGNVTANVDDMSFEDYKAARRAGKI